MLVAVPAFTGNKMASNLQLREEQPPNRPERAQISRDQSLQQTKSQYKTRGASDVKKVSLHDRINQFLGQHLSVRGNTIFCNACKEVVSSKKSILSSHCTSKKHTSGKEKIKKSKLREQIITEALSREKGRQDSTLPLAEQA